MSYYSNKNWTRVYKVTFNDVDIFLHKVHRRVSDSLVAENIELIVETIELEDDNTLTITEEQLPIVQRFGNGIKTMTYVGKLFGHKQIVNKEKVKET